MQELNAEQIEEAQGLIFPEAMVVMTKEDYERKLICAEHQRSLGDRLEWAVWEAYAMRHGGASRPPLHLPVPSRMRPRGFT